MTAGKGTATPSQGGYLVAKAHQIGGRVFARLLKEAGVTGINPAQGRILFALWKSEGMSLTALSKETALEPSTLTSMLDRLEAAGFARRIPSTDDRRAFIVECTESGRALEREYAELSDRMTAIFYRGLSPTEIAVFEKTLGRIVENLAAAE